MGIETKDDVIIQVEDISKVYSQGSVSAQALKNINLQIRKSEIVALTGPSGSGKSTLLQIIGSLDVPTSGTVRIGGTTLSGTVSGRALVAIRRHTVGFIFQSFYLEPYLTVRQNIALAGYFSGLNSQELETKTNKLAKLVGLEDRLNHRPSQLSGGEIQRVAVARALVNDPSILLADEPTGNLDLHNRDAIVDIFHNIRDYLGTTIVIATHDPAVVRGTDRYISLSDGELV